MATVLSKLFSYCCLHRLGGVHVYSLLVLRAFKRVKSILLFQNIWKKTKCLVVEKWLYKLQFPLQSLLYNYKKLFK